MKIKTVILTIQLSVLLCLTSGCGSSDDGILLSETVGMEQKEILAEEGGGETTIAKESQRDGIAKDGEKEQIYVQVSGAVVKPGVYTLDAGSRIFQAIELAGGVTESADTGSLNQAEILSDGQMVYIMETGEDEKEGSPAAKQDDGKVNINTATESELMTLPGIGESKARSILAWREANGNFTQIEDLMKVEGIKDGVFSKIKDSVKLH